jgi:hypothetical protein
MTKDAADNIVFLKMWLSHIAGKESQIVILVQRMRFSALSLHLQKYKTRYAACFGAASCWTENSNIQFFL